MELLRFWNLKKRIERRKKGAFGVLHWLGIESQKEDWKTANTLDQDCVMYRKTNLKKRIERADSYIRRAKGTRNSEESQKEDWKVTGKIETVTIAAGETRISKRGLKEYGWHTPNGHCQSLDMNLKKRIERSGLLKSLNTLTIMMNLKKRIERFHHHWWFGFFHDSIERISKRGLKDNLPYFFCVFSLYCVNLKKRIERWCTCIYFSFFTIKNLKKRIERIGYSTVPAGAYRTGISKRGLKVSKALNYILDTVAALWISKRGLKAKPSTQLILISRWISKRGLKVGGLWRRPQAS